MIAVEVSLSGLECMIFVITGNLVPLCGRQTDIYVSFT